MQLFLLLIIVILLAICELLHSLFIINEISISSVYLNNILLSNRLSPIVLIFPGTIAPSVDHWIVRLLETRLRKFYKNDVSMQAGTICPRA